MITMAVAGVTVTLATTNPWLVIGVVGLVCVTVIVMKGMHSSREKKNG